jgi:Fe-S oxidoreductase
MNSGKFLSFLCEREKLEMKFYILGLFVYYVLRKYGPVFVIGFEDVCLQKSLIDTPFTKSFRKLWFYIRANFISVR